MNFQPIVGIQPKKAMSRNKQSRMTMQQIFGESSLKEDDIHKSKNSHGAFSELKSSSTSGKKAQN